MEKEYKRKIIWICVCVCIFAILCYSSFIWVILEDKKTIKETNSNIIKEQNVNFTCSYKRDSLIKEVNKLSIYKALTKAMVFRDEATILLNYKVGDIVYTKLDSSRVIIEDIIIGGSKYQYYIKYRILYKDKKTEEVIPELIY